jgi:cytochrome c oxidase cbb3-type subunit 3
MKIRNGIAAAAVAALTIVVVHGGQQPPPPTAPPGSPTPTEAPAAPGRGGGRQGRGATFPAQQRPPGDPAIIERGRTLYSVTCSACHGVDARGGQLGGPNLLRSQLVLLDKDGELIVPVIQAGRPDKGMPPMPINADDGKAVATFLHGLLAAAGRQGSPPPTDAPPPDVLVGNATAGQAYFAAKCSACHSATGDLQGVATRIPDAKTLQNLWVSGGVAAGRGGRGGGGGGGGGRGSSAPVVTVTVTQASGEKAEGQLLRIDDFIVTLLQADGSVRSFRREGDRPKVDINDPLQGHGELLAVYTEKDMHDVTANLVTLK